MKNIYSEKGISLYYAVLMMSISLAVALGLNIIVIKSFRTTREVKKTPPAIHAADTGIEKALYDISTGNARKGSSTQATLDFGDVTITYTYDIINSTSTDSEYECPDDSMYCIYASGFYQGSRRFIKVVR